MKAYKSLEAYNQFYSGWVHTCYVKDTGEHNIIRANVNRSQALSEKPHEVWVALLRSNGTVVTGHCTCMAGLGEVCSHVAALLFKVEASTRLGFNQVSCTSVPCQWNQNFTKKVSAATLKEISFQKLRCDNFHNKIPTTVQIVEPAKFADPSSFLQKLRKTNPNAVIFSITNPKPQPKLCGPSLHQFLVNCTVRRLWHSRKRDYSHSAKKYLPV
ncbi:hypothetical protein ACJMK2_032303 [Sinanodonta woodiana]|uniref:SWIM-type domain-containing protein n=1 Tax=Sinanodonta woodiana TaxID=1069815 RepID=A0ABD3X342_SINWO